MDLMQIVVDIALVGLVSLTVIGVIAVTVRAAKAAKDGSHGCGPTEEEKAEQQRKALEAYHLSLWEVGVCKHCRHTKEVYLPYGECAGCMWDDFFNPSPDC